MLLLSTETDLESDPSETTNLKDSQPAVFAAMEERLHAIGATTFATDYTDMPNHLCLDAPAAIATASRQVAYSAIDISSLVSLSEGIRLHTHKRLFFSAAKQLRREHSNSHNCSSNS